MKKALISVFDKKGIEVFAKELSDLGFEIISTGGTADILRKADIDVLDVSIYTQFPELMDGRVKTLHPKIHAGLLASRDNQSHMQQAKENNIDMIDFVVVNLYPFEETVKKEKSFETTMEMIDIGGPSMLRSAAKNFKDVIAVCDPNDYSWILDEFKEKGDISYENRKKLAKKVFDRTACYEGAISRYLAGPDNFPSAFNMSFKKKQDMRYGENPYQDAAFYVADEIVEPSISSALQLSGKELSYNNIMDGDSALEIVKEFKRPCVAVIKHANPSGVALSKKIEDALEKAHNADSLSAYGCVIAMNRILTYECAKFLDDKFIEVVIAVDYEKEALDLLSKKKNRRLLSLPNLMQCYGSTCRHEKITIRKVVGGLLVQTRNFPDFIIDEVNITKSENPNKEEIKELTKKAKDGTLKELLCVTKKEPSKEELEDMIFALKVCKHVKSNSVLFAKDLVTVGIGAGQMSRVDSTIIASMKAHGRAKGAVMASDAFFPFRDGVDEASKSGITAIIQPGGSIRDKEVIDAANEHQISMVFTGTRLFLH